MRFQAILCLNNGRYVDIIFNYFIDAAQWVENNLCDYARTGFVYVLDGYHIVDVCAYEWSSTLC